jgi:voltage-gated potassium channel
MFRALQRLRTDDGYNRWCRRTETPLLILAGLFVVVLVLPLVTELSLGARRAIAVGNGAIWAVFAVDYVVRLYLAPDRRGFARTHLLDLAIVLLPMLRPLRALGVVRVLRIASVAGFAHKRAMESLHAKVTAYVASASVLALLIAGIAIREAERGSPEANITSFGDGVWWALTTVTTVGYGDHYPTTSLGRLVSLALMLVGIALLGVVTAAIAAWFIEHLQGVRAEEREAEERTEATLETVLAELREVRRRMEELEGPRR